ncbi:zinc transporter, putative [Leishmania tarentolae]|uniref:Zinc transporter, putative n=1 Tax=Leishmania tarentolae TaxID=5689 RepID=A0A640KK72_LEITA|nr:zinc transporter, putative [Leishmania tarentolae]
MTQPTSVMLRQLVGDLVRAAVAVEARDPLAAQPAVASAVRTITHSRGVADLLYDTNSDGTRTSPLYAESGEDHGHSHGDGSGSDHGHSHGDGSSSDHGHSHGDGSGSDHGHSHGTDSNHGHSHGCATVKGNYMLGWHIAAIFIILVASVVGTLIPIVGKRVPALRLPAYAYAVGKAAATGVVLAVAMIHMINHASVVFGADCIPESFREMYEGWAFLFAMIAAIVMHAIDGTIGWIVEQWSTRASSNASSTDPFHDSLCIECPAACRDELVERADEDGLSGIDGGVKKEQRGSSELPMDAAKCVGHEHSVTVPGDMPVLQRVVAALCMEFGVTLHSVFVGLAVAVSNGSDLRALIIALVFHQLFEGLAMGARLADASFKMSLEIALMLVFSLSAPIGIAAGTGAVVASRDAFSGMAYALVSAILDSICGGIMLYIAFNLLFVDFPHDLRVHCGLRSKCRVAKRIGLYAGLWIGAAVMAIIGKWL